jgi:hypothetical protein
MKKLIPIMFLVLSCGQNIDYTKAKLEDVFRPYGIEKGVIEYNYTGEEEGKEKLIFKDWGHFQVRIKETQAQHVPLKRFEILSPAEKVNYSQTCKCLKYKIRMDTLGEDKGVYYYDSTKGEYVKGNPFCEEQKREIREVSGVKQKVCTEYAWEGSIRPNALYDVLESIWDTASPKTKQLIGPAIKKCAKEMSIGFIYAAAIVEMPTKKHIAGREATFYKVYGKDVRIFVWKDIILGSEVLQETGKKIIVEAIKVDENPKITDDMFKIPPEFPAPVKYDTASFIYKQEKNIAEQVVNICLSEKTGKNQ